MQAANRTAAEAAGSDTLTLLKVELRGGEEWIAGTPPPRKDMPDAQVIRMFQLDDGSVRVFVATMLNTTPKTPNPAEIAYDVTLASLSISRVIRVGSYDAWCYQMSIAIEDEQGEEPDETDDPDDPGPSTATSPAPAAPQASPNGVS